MLFIGKEKQKKISNVPQPNFRTREAGKQGDYCDHCDYCDYCDCEGSRHAGRENGKDSHISSMKKIFNEKNTESRQEKNFRGKN